MYIYKVENKVDGRIYIGQTCDPVQRWKNHKACGKKKTKRSNNPMYDDMRTIGISKFEFTVLEECGDRIATKREAFWMDVYDSKNPEKGYNIRDAQPHEIP